MENKWKIYADAISHYGIDNQKNMLVEECGELLNAMAKHKRDRATTRDVITELADVSIMVEQMALFFGREQFDVEKERKIERLKYRLLDKDKKPLGYDENEMYDGTYKFNK